jgi:hypothetical protein
MRAVIHLLIAEPGRLQVSAHESVFQALLI